MTPSCIPTKACTNLNIEPGQKFYLRWKDFNATGADDALGIEDFKMEAIFSLLIMCHFS